jgi:hypothetical protein
MKVKDVSRLVGGADAAIALLIYNETYAKVYNYIFQNADISKFGEYINNINTFFCSSHVPVNQKVAGLVALTTLAFGTIGLGYLFSDGISDILTGNHHFLGQEIHYKVFPKQRELERREIDEFHRTLEKDLRRKPVSQI